VNTPSSTRNAGRTGANITPVLLATIWLLSSPSVAQASLLSGDALDAAANAVAWLALIIVPVVLISAFWLVHILPEKIAEKRRHPQLEAIKTLCLLSLFFGGMLWPLAWLWAYTKPVFHKMAYGTDQDEHAHHGEAFTPLHDAKVEVPSHPQHMETHASNATTAEWTDLQQQLDVLTRRLAAIEDDAVRSNLGWPASPGPTSSDRT